MFALLFSSFSLVTLIVPIAGIAQAECPAIPLQPEDRRLDKNRLVVASIEAPVDVTGIFDYHLHTTGSGSSSGSGELKMDPKERVDLDRLAMAIRATDADIVNIYGVESCAVLVALIDHLYDQGYRPYLLMSDDCFLPESVGLLTRIDPIENMRSALPDDALQASRERCAWREDLTHDMLHPPYHYWTRLYIHGKPLLLAGAYLHAFSSREVASPEQRLFQVNLLKELIEREGIENQSEVIFTGVFNNYDGELIEALSNVKLPPERTGRFYASDAREAQFRWVREHFKSMVLGDVLTRRPDTSDLAGSISGGSFDLVWLSDGLKSGLIRVFEGPVGTGVRRGYPLVLEIGLREAGAKEMEQPDAPSPSVGNGQPASLLPWLGILGLVALALALYLMIRR